MRASITDDRDELSRAKVRTSANGTFDSMETFNYPLGQVDNFTRQQLTAQATPSGQLKFSRTYGGTSQTMGSELSRPWPLTLSRRVLGATSWSTVLLTGSIAESYTDTTATAGTAYEYKADLDYDPSPATAFWSRHFVAGVEMPP